MRRMRIQFRRLPLPRVGASPSRTARGGAKYMSEISFTTTGPACWANQ